MLQREVGTGYGGVQWHRKICMLCVQMALKWSNFRHREVWLGDTEGRAAALEVQ